MSECVCVCLLLIFLFSASTQGGHPRMQLLKTHIWRGVNGPHAGTAWSWELWVANSPPAALGVAVVTFSRMVKDLDVTSLQKPLYWLFHCDSDEELTDHSARLAYVLPTPTSSYDPRTDVHFFKLTKGYAGNPIVNREHRTDEWRIRSMGEDWDRQKERESIQEVLRK